MRDLNWSDLPLGLSLNVLRDYLSNVKIKDWIGIVMISLSDKPDKLSSVFSEIKIYKVIKLNSVNIVSSIQEYIVNILIFCILNYFLIYLLIKY